MGSDSAASASVAARPASEASAKMVEALRTQQQHSSSDDRITLADLTLVAVASATQQMAASRSDSGGGAAPAAGSAGHGGGDHQKKDPEAERREIEELARHVIDEVKHQYAISFERSGRTWES